MDGNATVQPQEKGNRRTHFIYATIEIFSETGHIHSNQTGKFSVISSHGNQYFMIVYVYNVNAIIYTPMKNHIQEEHTNAFK